jgi:hypothetical protein
MQRVSNLWTDDKEINNIIGWTFQLHYLPLQLLINKLHNIPTSIYKYPVCI